jgi:hypothetical protein
MRVRLGLVHAGSVFPWLHKILIATHEADVLESVERLWWSTLRRLVAFRTLLVYSIYWSWGCN